MTWLAQPETLAGGVWLRFKRRHLFDYSRPAIGLWLAIAAAGTGACAWAVNELLRHPPPHWLLLPLGLSLVAAAALFPLQIPRTRNTVLVADAFIFVMLATLGAPAAVLAAGTEAAIGALRSSRRLTTWVSAPTSNMLAMAVCGLAHTVFATALLWLGLPLAAAEVTALCLAALVYVALTTGPLMTLIAMKSGQRLTLRVWLDTSTGIATMSLGAAFLAGLLVLNARQFGLSLLGVAATLVISLVLLLRRSFGRQEAERLAQEQVVLRAQQEAAQSQQRFTAAFTYAAIGMAVVQPGGAVLQVNLALCGLLGRSAEDLLGTTFSKLVHEEDAPQFERQVQAVAADEMQSFTAELRCRASPQAELWVAVHCSRYEGHAGGEHCLIYQLHDITARRMAESRLQHIAFHDGLTDLANRHSFHARLEGAVERSRTDADQRFAVLFLDLDRFKLINDSLGHMAGNELLRVVARRLCECVRPDDLVARLGGDEFAILLEDVHQASDGLLLAQRVLDALSAPCAVNGTEIVAGASIGITFSDLGYRTVEEVLRDADLAMYEAKGAGRGRVALFDSSMHDRVAEKLTLESDLRHAIGDGQLSVHFQPLYELEPYRLCGFEALARWVHPQRGPVSPAVFIALAEETGHIEALTDWVIDHAVARLAEWQLMFPGLGDLDMHVNISGRDLARASLVDHVQAVLQRHRLDASALTLEITETTLMGRLEVALQTMGRLRQTGVRFSIDDFGTGYSSLAYLGTLPIDSLKIDRSFVMGMHEQPQNVEIVRAVLNLGMTLGRKVIAEGIETPEQLSTLRSLGVPIGQGYLLSRPLRCEQVVELLALTEPVAA